MNRLQLELNRLYGLGANSTDGSVADAGHGENRGDVRALVLELALPASGVELASVWKGVQTDFELPAPAIAISGIDGLQLWFALASPILQSTGARFLEGLRARYLPDVKPTQVRLITAAGGFAPVPPVERSPDRWSAFVSPDLVSVFSETPWLDVPPTEEGQAALLRALVPIQRAAFDAALGQLAAAVPHEPATAARHPQHENADPVRFLTNVMQDETAPLSLRIEAAKALLPHTGSLGRRPDPNEHEVSATGSGQ